MNPLQRAFVDVFKAWDSDARTRALIALLEAFGGQVLGAETREEIGWRCREMLSNIFSHPNVSGALFVPEIPVSLLLETGVVWTKKPGVSQHSAITINIGLSAQAPENLKTRWSKMTFVSSSVLINRAEVHTPAPLKDEPGYLGRDPAQPNIHRPKGDISAPPMQTYAYALSVEAGAASPWLVRYQAGERKPVWDELTALGDAVRHPEMLPHAVAVARETMRRCRINVERLHAWLRQQQYHFRQPERALVPPAEDILNRIAELEQRVGPLPLSLCAWYELVGAVNFMVEVEDRGNYADYSDPLGVGSAEQVLEYDEDNWNRGLYRVDLAPDYYHKDDVSGGPAYSIFLPDAGMDTFFNNEPHNTTFANYLRIAFAHEGFPATRPGRGLVHPSRRTRYSPSNASCRWCRRWLLGKK